MREHQRAEKRANPAWAWRALVALASTTLAAAPIASRADVDPHRANRDRSQFLHGRLLPRRHGFRKRHRRTNPHPHPLYDDERRGTGSSSMAKRSGRPSATRSARRPCSVARTLRRSRIPTRRTHIPTRSTSSTLDQLPVRDGFGRRPPGTGHLPNQSPARAPSDTLEIDFIIDEEDDGRHWPSDWGSTSTFWPDRHHLTTPTTKSDHEATAHSGDEGFVFIGFVATTPEDAIGRVEITGDGDPSWLWTFPSSRNPRPGVASAVALFAVLGLARTHRRRP